MKVLKISTLFDKKMKQILYVPTTVSKFLYLYPDMLELYGDYGNIQVLKYRLEARGYTAIIDRYSIGDEAPNFCDYDIVFAGRWC